MGHSDFNVSYSAEHRLLRVRFLMYLSALALVGTIFPTMSLIEAFETGVEPNGEAISRGEVAALLVICQLAAWAFFVGMHIYGRCYVLRIFTSAERPESVYETVGWIGRVPWVVGEDDKQACRFHAGKTRGFYSASAGVTVMSVDAPYHTQRIKSRRLPFIIDGSGFFLN